jgi:succinate dehydrogenase/fumarate reductase flavoprotein subunit
MNVDTYPRGGGPVVSGRGGTAIVIGSGFGGLAAAIRLSVRGWRVQVLERLPSSRCRSSSSSCGSWLAVGWLTT